MNGVTTKERLTRLETQMQELLTNHIPHIEGKIDKLTDKVDRGSWLAITVLVGVVIELAFLILK